MPNEQLVAYVRDQLIKGIPRDEIVRTLIATGWLIQDINTAFESSTISTPSASDLRPRMKIFARIWDREILIAFLLALALGAIVFMGFSTWDETRNFLQQDSFSGSIEKLIYYPAVPITLPIDYFLYHVVRFPVPIGGLYYPPAVLIVWTAIFYILIILTRHFFPNASRIIKYIPSFLVAGFFAIVILFSMLDTRSRDEAFLEKCLGPEAVSSSCFIDFVENKIRADFYPLLPELRASKNHPNPEKNDIDSKGNALISKYIDYCFSLPEKSVNDRAMRYQFSSLSYNQYCLFVFIGYFETEGELIPSLQDFRNRFPKWQPGVVERFSLDYRTDVRKYFCERVYGSGALRENAKDYSTCMQPRFFGI